MIAPKHEVLAWMQKTVGKTISNDDLALLDLVHGPAEQAIKDELGSSLEYGQHTEYLPIGLRSREEVTLADYDMQNGRVVAAGRYNRADRLQLKHTPVHLAGLEVREDVAAYAGQSEAAFGAGTLLTCGKDYYLDLEEDNGYSESGILIRTNGTWSAEPRSIKVTYSGGWTAEQLHAEASAIRMAAILTVAKAFREAKANASNGGAGALTSETIGKYSATYASTSIANLGITIAIPGEAMELIQKKRNYGRLFG